MIIEFIGMVCFEIWFGIWPYESFSQVKANPNLDKTNF